MSERQNAKCILSDANQVWESAYGHKLSDVLPKLCPESHLTPKRSKAELKKQNRQMERRLMTHVGTKGATIVTLGTGESFSQYNRNLCHLIRTLDPANLRNERSTHQVTRT